MKKQQKGISLGILLIIAFFILLFVGIILRASIGENGYITKRNIEKYMLLGNNFEKEVIRELEETENKKIKIKSVQEMYNIISNIAEKQDVIIDSITGYYLNEKEEKDYNRKIEFSKLFSHEIINGNEGIIIEVKAQKRNNNLGRFFIFDILYQAGTRIGVKGEMILEDVNTKDIFNVKK